MSTREQIKRLNRRVVTKKQLIYFTWLLNFWLPTTTLLWAGRMNCYPPGQEWLNEIPEQTSYPQSLSCSFHARWDIGAVRGLRQTTV